MPSEWNEKLASMIIETREMAGGHRNPTEEEIMMPIEYAFSNKSTIAPTVSTEVARSEEQIAAMVEEPTTYEPGKLTTEDIPRLRQAWKDKYKEIGEGTPTGLPPWREVNHEINLIDPEKVYKYHLPRCPKSMQQQLTEKVKRYVQNGWWEPHSAKQAAPLLCIPKKDGTLRTALDARQRNDNTVKDVTPLPDQELIREDVA